MKYSDQERALLRALQADATASLADLAERVGMAPSTVWRRVQDFEAAGLVRARVALLDPAKVGASLCIFAAVRLSSHTPEAIDGFAAIIRARPEIMEAHSTSGTADYMLKIRCADVAAYETLLSQHLLRAPHVKSVVSSFGLRELKFTTALPI